MMRNIVRRTLACMVLVSACSSDPDTSGRGFPSTSGTGAGAGGTGSTAGAVGTAGIDNPERGGIGGLGGIGGSGGDGGNLDECSGVSETAKNMVQPVDIIFGIDTSGSMGEEIAFVQENLNAFSQQIIDSGIDVRVILLATEGSAEMGGNNCVVIIPGFPCVPSFGGGRNFGVCIGEPLGSGTCPEDSNPTTYQHVPAEVGSNDVLNVFINAYPQYSQYLRPGSLKHFVSITDDDATDPPYNSADAFIAAVGALDPDPTMWSTWSYSSIYCFTQCPAAAAAGLVHQDLVAKTMGVGGDLCLQEFGPVFEKLASEVAESVQLACEWDIPPPPEDETFDSNKTNVELTLDGTMELLPRLPAGTDCADLAAWRYDDEANPTKVLACPAACTRIQSAVEASVNIVFGCDTVPIVLQ